MGTCLRWRLPSVSHGTASSSTTASGARTLSKKTAQDQIRDKAEKSLEAFITLVHPGAVLGDCHRDVIEWWNRPGASSHQVLLFPRDHQKSRLVAYRAAQAVVRNPAIRILYISSTANLATKQLKFIKDILTSDVVRHYWPGLVNIDEGKREKWTETEISVDHPLRKMENVRDPTIFTAGLTTTITGLHCDIQIMDDVVVRENAYTEEGRAKTREQYSLLASIAGGEAVQWVVGTRYHPKDLYNDLLTMKVAEFDEHGDPLPEYLLYENYERAVEDRGDGTGKFLWPRQQRDDGRWFGFNSKILAKKKAQYLDKVQFRAQYYNDPNDNESAGIGYECFQYYDKTFLSRTGGNWFFKGARLNVFAAVDFAYTTNKDSDYSAIVVVGVDSANNYYVLDIDRFKTNQISEYFKHILALHQKWDFRKLRAEVTAAQEMIVNDLKQNYVRKHGLALSIDDYRPTRAEGTKKERIDAALQARYNNRQIWHLQSGNWQLLEEELVLSNPAHDDIKDCLASAIDTCIAPTFNRRFVPTAAGLGYHGRFGGIV